MTIFQSIKSVPNSGARPIPARVCVTVVGVDGGTYEVLDLYDHRKVNVSKAVFEESFVRWN